jgi:hypothetical protein
MAGELNPRVVGGVATPPPIRVDRVALQIEEPRRTRLRSVVKVVRASV